MGTRRRHNVAPVQVTWHNVTTMAYATQVTAIRVGRQGRLVIPAGLRARLGIDAGDSLVVRLEEGRLVLEKREAVLRRLRDRFRHIPPGVSLAEELIEERRQEAYRESDD